MRAVAVEETSFRVTLGWLGTVLGAVLGVVDLPSVDEVGLATVLAAVGGMLTFAFRSNPGPVCREWQRARRAGPGVVYRTYARGGPWAWRLAVGLLVGTSLHRVL